MMTCLTTGPRGGPAMKNQGQAFGGVDVLTQISIGFLPETKDKTPGAEMEKWLNARYGENSQLYRDLARLITAGFAEGRAANLEVNGRNYRRSGILEPAPQTYQFSITAV